MTKNGILFTMEVTKFCASVGGLVVITLHSGKIFIGELSAINSRTFRLQENTIISIDGWLGEERLSYGMGIEPRNVFSVCPLSDSAFFYMNFITTKNGYEYNCIR